MPRYRLPILVLVAACLLASGCAAPAASATPTSPVVEAIAAKSGVIRYADLSNFDVRDMPMQMALDALAAQGYTVRPTYFGQTNQMVDSLARGDSDIGWANDQTTWAAIQQGAALRTVAQTTVTTAILAVSNEIQACADLNGRPIGITTTKGATATLVFTYVQQTCPGTEPNYLVVTGNDGRAAALQSGQVDGVLVQNEELLRIQAASPGKYHALVYLGQEFPNIQIDGLQVNKDWAEQNPQIVRDFIAALLTAHRRVIADPELLYAEAVKRLQLDPDTAKAVADSCLSIGVWNPNGGLSAESVQASLDFYVAQGAFEAGLKVDDVADLSYLNAVLDEIGRQ